MDKRYDVFISYSSVDQKVTEGTCGFLEARGIRCFCHIVIFLVVLIGLTT